MELIAGFTELPRLIATVFVVILAWLFPISWRYSPLRPAKVLANLFSQKVNKPGNEKQQQISGALALVTYLVMILTIVWALLFIMPTDVVTSAVLLWVSLSYDALARNNALVGSALKTNQLSLARGFLAEYANSDCKKLSELGVTKSAIEQQGIWFISGWLVPIVLFVALGGIASLIYALVVTAAFAWPVFNSKHTHFGQFAFYVKSGIETAILFIFVPIFIAFKHCSGFYNLYQKNHPRWPSWQSRAELMILSILASGLRSEMAGPIMSDGEKVSRPRLNKGADCKSERISELTNWFTRIRLFVMVLLLLFWAVGNIAAQ